MYACSSAVKNWHTHRQAIEKQRTTTKQPLPSETATPGQAPKHVLTAIVANRDNIRIVPFRQYLQVMLLSLYRPGL